MDCGGELQQAFRVLPPSETGRKEGRKVGKQQQNSITHKPLGLNFINEKTIIHNLQNTQWK